MGGDEVEASVDARIHLDHVEGMVAMLKLAVLLEERFDLRDDRGIGILRVLQMAPSWRVVDRHANDLALVVATPRKRVVTGVESFDFSRRFVLRELSRNR